MRIRKVLTLGFFAGMIIGGGVTLLEVAPTTVAVLMKPLEWLTDGLRPYPRESLGNLIIALPLAFIYWGCVGALVGLLLRLGLRVFCKPEQPKSDILKPPEGA